MKEKRILLVNKELIVLRETKLLLEDLGFNFVIAVQHIWSAMNKLEEIAFSIILFDINLDFDESEVDLAESLSKRFEIPLVYLVDLQQTEYLTNRNINKPYQVLTKPFQAKDLFSSIENALYTYDLEKKLYSEELFFTEIIDGLEDPVIILDSDYKVLYINIKAVAFVELPKEKIINKELDSILSISEEENKAKKNIFHLFEDKSNLDFLFITNNNQKVVQASIILKKVNFHHRKVNFITIKNIKNANNLVMEDNISSYKKILNNIPIPIIVSKNKSLFFLNKEANILFNNYDTSTLIKNIPSGSDNFETTLDLAEKEKVSLQFIKNSFVYDNNALEYFIVWETSSFKQQENNIIQYYENLFQKSTHHFRTHLQLLSSIFNLQMRAIKDIAIMELFKDNSNRLKTISYIYDAYPKSKYVEKAEIYRFVEKIISNLFLTYKVSTNDIKVSIKIESVSLDNNKLFPIGMLINEAVSNSIKYAFKNSRKGVIDISLLENNNKINLIVTDNGNGLDQNIDIDNMQTFGLQLMYILAEQLGSHLQFESKEGFIISVNNI